MLNNKGFSLTEVLVTVGILSIMSGIATMSYRGYDLVAEKRNFRQAGRQFALAVNNCVRSVGGWQIKRPVFYDDDNDPDTPEVYGKPMYPCDADGLDDSDENATQTDPDILEKELKKKLGFDCPGDIENCAINSRAYDGPGYDGPMGQGKPIPSRQEYYCLSIQKEVSGKELQVLVTIPKNSVSYYKVFCKEGFLLGNTIPDILCRGIKDVNSIKKQKDQGFLVCDWHCTTQKCRDDIAELNKSPPPQDPPQDPPNNPQS